MLSTQKFRLPIVILSILPAMCAFAGVRHFTFLYEAPTSPPGSIELENMVTWAHGAGWNDAFIREELEIGITDRLQLGIYPLDWSHHSEGGFQYNGGAVELIYNLSNPVVDPVGISLYQEVSVARRHFESESKLIAQKNLGRWILDYNATLEAEWEAQGLKEQNGELQQALSASYEIRRGSRSELNFYTNSFSRIGVTTEESETFSLDQMFRIAAANGL